MVDENIDVPTAKPNQREMYKSLLQMTNSGKR
jgi:hypothetical protein